MDFHHGLLAIDDSGPYVIYRLDASVSSDFNSFVPPQDLITNWGHADYLTRDFYYNLQPGDSGTAQIFESSSNCNEEYPCTTMDDDIQVSIHTVRLDVGHPAVPEPATGMLVLIALSGIMLVRRRPERGFRFRSH